jgi:hypothetical protein
LNALLMSESDEFYKGRRCSMYFTVNKPLVLAAQPVQGSNALLPIQNWNLQMFEMRRHHRSLRLRNAVPTVYDEYDPEQKERN